MEPKDPLVLRVRLEARASRVNKALEPLKVRLEPKALLEHRGHKEPLGRGRKALEERREFKVHLARALVRREQREHRAAPETMVLKVWAVRRALQAQARRALLALKDQSVPKAREVPRVRRE
jgi:hypothetical protein